MGAASRANDVLIRGEQQAIDAAFEAMVRGRLPGGDELGNSAHSPGPVLRRRFWLRPGCGSCRILPDSAELSC